jgi:hypothetical protein
MQYFSLDGHLYKQTDFYTKHNQEFTSFHITYWLQRTVCRRDGIIIIIY